MTVHTDADMGRPIRYDDGTGRILTIYQKPGDAPMAAAKKEAAEAFRDIWLADFVARLILFSADKLTPEQSRALVRDMREQRRAAAAFERIAHVEGQGWVEAYNGAVDGVDAARFGDRRFENKVAEFRALVDRLFPRVYEAGDAAALAALAPVAAKK